MEEDTQVLAVQDIPQLGVEGTLLPEDIPLQEGIPEVEPQEDTVPHPRVVAMGHNQVDMASHQQADMVSHQPADTVSNQQDTVHQVAVQHQQHTEHSQEHHHLPEVMVNIRHHLLPTSHRVEDRLHNHQRKRWAACLYHNQR